jgi:hypothetical protein
VRAVRRASLRRCAAGVGALFALQSCSTVGVSTADTALYVRSDTNATTVYAPRAHVGARLGDSAGLDVTYAVDSWTGASIDVTTAATHAIHEIRHEVNAGAYYAVKNVTLSAGYRYSTENDYWSNGGVGSVSIDMFEKNTNLTLTGLGSQDIVGRSGDSDFRRPTASLGGRLTLSQVLDKKTVLQASAEMVQLTGYLASPYRFVGVNGAGLCAGAALDCLPESHPHERLRTSFFGTLRRAFGDHVSIGLEYRYYFDNWGVRSDTVSPEIAILAGEHGTLSFAYRFYLQGDADFYQSQYLQPSEALRYYTRDRKLSSFSSHRIGAEYMHQLSVGESGDTVLQLGARAGLTRIEYDEFVGLQQVDVLEATGLLGLLFR